MNSIKLLAVILVIGLVFIFIVSGCGQKGDATKVNAKKTEAKAQTNCPVMAGKIDKNIFVDHNGSRIYFCCPGCKEAFYKDPEKYIKVLEKEGVKLEPTPAKTEGSEKKGEE